MIVILLLVIWNLKYFLIVFNELICVTCSFLWTAMIKTENIIHWWIAHSHLILSLTCPTISNLLMIPLVRLRATDLIICLERLSLQQTISLRIILIPFLLVWSEPANVLSTVDTCAWIILVLRSWKLILEEGADHASRVILRGLEGLVSLFWMLNLLTGLLCYVL